MDIYRFFHPHHNPRLFATPLRQQELSELEQAAAELSKALVRAQNRSTRSPVAPIMAEHFTDVIKAMNFVERSLQTLCDAHPGDGRDALKELVQERAQSGGWDGWSKLILEQLSEENGLIPHTEA